MNIVTLCFVFSSLLFLRSFCLCIFEKKKLSGLMINCSLAAVYFVLALLFLVRMGKFISGPSTFFYITLAIAFALLIVRRIKKGPSKSFLKIFGFAGFICICTLGFALTLFSEFTQDRPLLKVVMPGQKRQEWVDWKSPRGPLKRSLESAYLVKLETLSGERLSEFYIFGDLLGIRAKVLRFKPLLHFLGLSNFCKIECVYSSYHTVERINSLPIEAYGIPEKINKFSYFQHYFWNLWESLFFQNIQSNWIKCATLESSYFPLADKSEKPFCGSFYLTINDGGLSSLCADKE